MHTSATVVAFTSTYMYTTVLKQFLQAYKNLFDDNHLVAFTVFLVSSVNTSADASGMSTWKGASSGWATYTEKCMLPSLSQVNKSDKVYSSFYDTGAGQFAFSLFNLLCGNVYNNFDDYIWLYGYTRTGFGVVTYNSNIWFGSPGLNTSAYITPYFAYY